MSLRLAIALGLALFASTDTRADSMFRGNPEHTGDYAGPALRQFHKVRWSFQTGDWVVGSAVVDHGRVYVASNDGFVYAINADTGLQIWNRATRGPVPSTPALANGTLYVTSYDGKLYALNADTGTTRWKFATGGERRFEAKGIHGQQPSSQTMPDIYDVYLSSPVVVNGVVYFGSGDGHVYAIDAASGELRWKFETGDVVHASPAYADGVIYVGSWDGKFYAIEAVTGAQRWSFQAGVDLSIHNQQGFQSSAAVVDGVVYVGCRDAHLYALDAKTGDKRWEFLAGLSWINTSPAVRDGKVYVATSDSALIHALDAATGKEIYQKQAKSIIWGSLSLAGDAFVVSQFNGSLEGRDLQSGDVLWSFTTDAAKKNEGWVLNSDGGVNNSLVYQSNWLEEPATAMARMFSVGSFVATPTIANGVVYVGSTDGKVYAIE